VPRGCRRGAQSRGDIFGARGRAKLCDLVRQGADSVLDRRGVALRQRIDPPGDIGKVVAQRIGDPI
jgi:hypothetical protein